MLLLVVCSKGANRNSKENNFSANIWINFVWCRKTNHLSLLRGSRRQTYLGEQIMDPLPVITTQLNFCSHSPHFRDIWQCLETIFACDGYKMRTVLLPDSEQSSGILLMCRVTLHGKEKSVSKCQYYFSLKPLFYWNEKNIHVALDLITYITGS